MPPDPFLHERSDFADLIRIVADERGLLPALVVSAFITIPLSTNRRA